VTKIAALGLDAGSTTVKLVAVDAAGELVAHRLEDTDPQLKRQMARLVESVRRELDAAAAPLVATGYGRNLVEGADKVVTEITCHAKGVFRRVGHGGTLIDIGGQDSKVIVIGERGKVVSFGMNDKCAAGTGRFLEVSASRLKYSMDAFSHAALGAQGEVAISSTCTVFAESEMISLIAQGGEVDEIVRGLHRSLVRRIAALARGAGIQPPLMLSGGVAKNAAVRRFLSEELGAEILVPPEPQLMGAYGAALIGLG
jgi:(R)-2-hydroxyacyl-CoA dehydratese activating ATPase